MSENKGESERERVSMLEREREGGGGGENICVGRVTAVGDAAQTSHDVYMYASACVHTRPHRTESFNRSTYCCLESLREQEVQTERDTANCHCWQIQNMRVWKLKQSKNSKNKSPLEREEREVRTSKEFTKP